MNSNEAKDLVIKAGIRLVESGLIVRTWGNVSCRIDDRCFAITPSGMDYLKLKPEQIVSVNMADCSYSGNIKPSSEKGIHAEVYQKYPDINFIIHTHQQNASIISASGLDFIKLPDDTGNIACAAYGLPGTKKLRNHVCSALSRSNAHAVIMKNHGALCFGDSFEQAFAAAEQLENTCNEYILSQYLHRSGKSSFTACEMANFALALPEQADCQSLSSLYNSRRTTHGFDLFNDAGAELHDASAEVVSLHRAIYKSCKSINHIYHICTPEIVAVANKGLPLKPLLDDFAQIVGLAAKNVSSDPQKIAHAIKSSPVVLVPGYGALCCGKSADDAAVAQLLTQKACMALIGASVVGTPCLINPFECMLMRFVYLKKYSRQMDQK